MTRRIDRALLEMAGLDSIDELERHFIHACPGILPGDCVAWNNWMPDWSAILSGRLNGDYQQEFQSRLDAFNHVVNEHPVIRAGRFPSSSRQVLRMSDFESIRSFRNNPLFREIYRHIDSRHQIAFTPCLLPDRRVLLTLNRRARDFTTREMELLHYTGLRLDQVAQALHWRQMLEQAWHALCAFAGSRLPGDAGSLGPRDLELLAMLLHGMRPGEIARTAGIRRDTLDKRLGNIRARLGMDNNRQLLSALAGLVDT